jgi:DivIVA domain-containing protein
MRSHESEGSKQFDVGFRGYKRDAVDEYVARLHGWLLDSEARAENAVEAATVAVGERASEILRAALVMGEQARQEADDIKAGAVENAEAEAERVMEDAHLQIAELQQSIDTLVVRRANVLSELGRLRQYLAAAAHSDSQRRDPDVDDAVEVDVAAPVDLFGPVDEATGDAPIIVMSAAPDAAVEPNNGARPVASSA